MNNKNNAFEELGEVLKDAGRSMAFVIASVVVVTVATGFRFLDWFDVLLQENAVPLTSLVLAHSAVSAYMISRLPWRHHQHAHRAFIGLAKAFMAVAAMTSLVLLVSGKFHDFLIEVLGVVGVLLLFRAQAAGGHLERKINCWWGIGLLAFHLVVIWAVFFFIRHPLRA